METLNPNIDQLIIEKPEIMGNLNRALEESKALLSKCQIVFQNKEGPYWLNKKLEYLIVYLTEEMLGNQVLNGINDNIKTRKKRTLEQTISSTDAKYTKSEFKIILDVIEKELVDTEKIISEYQTEHPEIDVERDEEHIQKQLKDIILNLISTYGSLNKENNVKFVKRKIETAKIAEEGKTKIEQLMEKATFVGKDKATGSDLYTAKYKDIGEEPVKADGEKKAEPEDKAGDQPPKLTTETKETPQSLGNSIPVDLFHLVPEKVLTTQGHKDVDLQIQRYAIISDKALKYEESDNQSPQDFAKEVVSSLKETGADVNFLVEHGFTTIATKKEKFVLIKTTDNSFSYTPITKELVGSAKNEIIRTVDTNLKSKIPEHFRRLLKYLKITDEDSAKKYGLDNVTITTEAEKIILTISSQTIDADSGEQETLLFYNLNTEPIIATAASDPNASAKNAERQAAIRNTKGVVTVGQSEVKE